MIIGSLAGQVSRLIADLHDTFALRDLGVLSYIFGVEAIYSNNAIHFSLSKYIADLLAKIDMSDCKPAKTPSSIGNQSLNMMVNPLKMLLCIEVWLVLCNMLP